MIFKDSVIYNEVDASDPSYAKASWRTYEAPTHQKVRIYMHLPYLSDLALPSLSTCWHPWPLPCAKQSTSQVTPPLFIDLDEAWWSTQFTKFLDLLAPEEGLQIFFVLRSEHIRGPTKLLFFWPCADHKASLFGVQVPSLVAFIGKLFSSLNSQFRSIPYGSAKERRETKVTEAKN